MPTRRQARVITSLNLKGGVGKTHLCWLTLGVCEERGLNCLVIDLDKQANISTTLLDELDGEAGSEQFFNAAIDPQASQLIRKTTLEYVDIIPASIELERYNMTDPVAWKSTGMQTSLVDPIRELSQFYDYILIDCPADISLITYAALTASQFLLLPLEAAEWGALGPQHVVATCKHIQDHDNTNLALLGVVVSRFKKARGHQKEYVRQLRKAYGDDAFDTVIPDSAKFEQAVNERIPITLHSPTSYASTIARQFFDELEARCQRLDRSCESSRSAGLSK